MKLKIINGHLTGRNKQHIKYIMENYPFDTQIKMQPAGSRITYTIEKINPFNYKVRMEEMLTQTIGAKPTLFISHATFKVL